MSREFVDLDADSRLALEFDALLEHVASFARTAMGHEAVRGLAPLAREAAVRQEIEAVAQARRYVQEQGRLLGGALPEARPAEATLAVAGLRLDPVLLRDLAAVGQAAAEIRASLLSLSPELYPDLRARGEALADLGRESRPVLAAIDSEGKILDEASAELKAIRNAQARVAERLQALLRRLVREPGSEAVIQDDFVTQRNGRFVIPVRTDAPRPVRGIVHASSSSGATRFVEPLESVELNNELVRLAEQEQEEQERILSTWTDAFRRRLPEVRAVLSGITHLDALQARALFADEAGGTEPRVARGGPLALASLLHPLLDLRLRQQGSACVPVSLALDPSAQVLVLSGPNTGGKTVVLKSVGLAVLMAQCGIPVTAARATLPLYEQVRADIGDHQSIQADLSTYSAHVRAVASFLREAHPPTLFLFDEIGTGTEPTEGAALAQSVLESLLGREVTAVATTHLGALKAWAFTTQGAASAAMEFDTESFRPTYRILMGAAGTSAGLDMAERLGLDPEIVRRARARLGPEASEIEGYLERLRETLSTHEARASELAGRQRELEEDTRRLLEQVDREEQRRRERAGAALEQAVRELRERGRQELAAIQDKRERARVEKQLTQSELRLEREKQRLQAELAPPPGETHRGWIEAAELAVGSAVFVKSLNKEGVVAAVRGDRVEVQLGRMVFTVPRSELRVPEASEREPAAAPSRPGKWSSPAPSTEARGGDPGSSREIVLVGKRVEEALEELDRFLDSALLSGSDEVRVVHGHGTGRLRSAVRQFLKSHRQVRGQRPGKPEEGADAVTVVTLA